MPDFRKSKYLADAVIDWVAGTNMPAAPLTCYVAMYTQAPLSSLVLSSGNAGYDSDVHGVECSYTSYARQAITWGSKSGTDKTVIKNSDGGAGIDFPANDGGTDLTIRAWVIFDEAAPSVSDNALYVLTYGEDEALLCRVTQAPRIEDDNLIVSEE